MAKRKVTEDCPVCCSPYTSTVRRPLECPGCHYAACTTCVKKYLLSVTHDAECMQCHHPFDREFLTKMLSRSFVDTTYRAHRQNVLVDREMALLPDAQHSLANFRLAIRCREQIEGAANLLIELQHMIRDIDTNRRLAGAQLHAIIASNYETDGRGVNAVTQEALRERARFLRGCPSETCRGFITMQHKCGTCDLRVCRTCLEALPGGENAGDTHVCDPETAATAAVLRRDTRPCPSCATMITKVDGCDQMFCTVCHIAFSWRTGHIEQGRIHNPHYYAWLRSQSATGEIPREPGDGGDGCGQGMDNVPRYATVRYALHQAAALDPSSPKYIQISDFHRELMHVAAVEIPPLRRQTDDMQRVQRANTDLRLQYLIGQLGREEWKRLLFVRERTMAKRVEHRQIFEMYLSVVGDNIRAFVAGAKNADAIIEEMKAVARHANAAFRSVAIRYACVAKRVYAGAAR